MNQALIVRNDTSLTIAFTESALALKQSALERAALIGKVDNAETQESAVVAQKELANVLTLVERARKQAKEPVLDFGRAIDATAAEFVQEAKEEQMRLAQLVADFQQLEAARIRAAEQARLAEQRRLEMERRAEEERVRREAEAERRRIADEQARIEREAEIKRKKLADDAAKAAREAADAKNAKERELAKAAFEEAERKRKQAQAEAEAARLEAERQKALAVAKTHEELDKINQRHCEEVAALPVAAPIRAEGQRVREDWEITVTDIWALVRAHPVCVSVEPRLSEIRNLLDAGVKVSGVTAKRVVKAGVTSGKLRPAIDV